MIARLANFARSVTPLRALAFALALVVCAALAFPAVAYVLACML